MQALFGDGSLPVTRQDERSRIPWQGEAPEGGGEDEERKERGRRRMRRRRRRTQEEKDKEEEDEEGKDFLSEPGSDGMEKHGISSPGIFSR